MQITNLIGKQIFSPTGESLGTCLSVNLSRDFTKLSTLICIDGEEEEFFLPVRAIKAIQDVIIAAPTPTKSVQGLPAPIGKPVLSHQGEDLGIATDLSLTDSSALFVTKNGLSTQYPLNAVAFGERLIVYPSAEEKPTKKCRKTSPSAKSSKRNAKTEQATPQIEPTHRLDLIGKTVKKTVYTQEGAPLVSAGEIITPTILRKARLNNRLLQLTVNTLTNII